MISVKFKFLIVLCSMLVFVSSGAHAHDHADSNQHVAKNSLSVEKLWELKRLGGPVVSPNKAHIIVSVTDYDLATDKGHTQLFLFNPVNGESRAITAKGMRASEPTFSPDSSQLAFISKRGDDEVGQVYILPMTGPGEAQRLTNVPTGVKGIKWVGNNIYFISSIWPELSWDEMSKKIADEKKNHISAQQWNALPYSHFDHWIDENKEAHLFRIPAVGGDVEAITQKMQMQLPRSNQSSASYDVDNKEHMLSFIANGWDNQVDPNLDVFLVDISSISTSDTLTPTNITANNPAPDFAPSFSPGSKTLVFLSRQIPGFYADTAKIQIFDIDKMSASQLDIDIDRSITNLTWAANGRDFYSQIDDAGTRRLYFISGKNGKTRAITRETDFGEPLLLDKNTLVSINNSFMYPPRLVKVNTKNGNVTRLDSFNDDALKDVKMGTYESVTYKGADGADVQMWIHYPPGFDKNKKYPLFMLIHGGPHNAITDGFHFRWNAQTFASWGYVVAWPNFHGSSGFGQDFADSINPDWRTKPLTDIQKATEYFEQQSYIDTDRMVAGGASYGGYLSSVLLGTEHPYKALLIHAAVYNMYSQMAADFAVHSTRFGGFWENPDIYKQISPHYAAANFTTPTLVIHGQLDYRVPVGQGFELFRTLQTKGIDSRMIYFPDENHWILKPNNSIYWYNQVKDWMTSYAEPGAK